ncbi:MAG: hypothetical protein NXH75_15140 [Halobacteriovoraceae bacterium]|nr:hypothetical protein [Halobacteriovoraceae bacterium]
MENKKTNIGSRKDPLGVAFSKFFLGTLFFLSGLQGFLGFPLPFPLEGHAQELGALMASPLYFTLKGTELLVGLFFIFNFFVPTALVITTPIVMGICLFNLWINLPWGLLSLVLIIPVAHLYFYYRETFKLFFLPQMYTNTMGNYSPTINVEEEERKLNKLGKKSPYKNIKATITVVN